ncbi:cell division protein ZapA [Novosphingobium sp. PC22D]|uniref:cell division protein ZapA n=1 Tax=Novosphingobium sp. PC22D TaxID=1962403 RepID=UPI000BEF4DA4|nr:cell division protein ZapA [Novosphingobium sp. PC22D]PEQ11805.1 cell division protein ZapA [Novosphingobium sp. PC22D]
MSNVSLSIGGRDYTVACADGEEDHIRGLGRLVDAKLVEARNAPNQSESRTLLFAALLVADELHECRANAGAASDAEAIDPALADRMARMADRLENLATLLEGTAPAS